ncbi:MAG: hypothetical protein MZV64_59955 [Ignavibacteriales bacterium]|nr:hypothetical protein [Ignavibacteriales bacterium]
MLLWLPPQGKMGLVLGGGRGDDPTAGRFLSCHPRHGQPPAYPNPDRSLRWRPSCGLGCSSSAAWTRRSSRLTFIAGLAYVLTFIDGVAPIAKYTTSHDDPFWNGMYVMSQQVSWWGAAAWAIFIFAAFKKKSWAIPVGIFAGAMSMLAGYPLGLHNALFEVHRFSMFLPAPLMSTGLVIYLLLPSTRRMLEAWNAKE